MATSTSDSAAGIEDNVHRITLPKVVLAGLAAGSVFGLVMSLTTGWMGEVGVLYTAGSPDALVGWGVHLVHAAVLAVAFGVASEYDPLHGWMERGPATAVALGSAFALSLYLVNVGVVWPVWLQAVLYAPALSWSVPHLPVAPLAGHLAYGVTLGALLHFLVDY